MAVINNHNFQISFILCNILVQSDERLAKQKTKKQAHYVSVCDMRQRRQNQTLGLLQTTFFGTRPR